MSEKELITLKPPLEERDVRNIEAGDLVEVSGTIFTARDEAYERILEKLRKGEELPVDLKGGVVYHCGPLVKREEGKWKVIAAGPTTSARMDEMEREFVEGTGVRAIIGKGGLGPKAAREISERGTLYLAYTGGAAALAADSVISVKEVHWEDLGTAEAVWGLEVENFGPMLVGVDVRGNDLYDRN